MFGQGNPDYHLRAGREQNHGSGGQVGHLEFIESDGIPGRRAGICSVGARYIFAQKPEDLSQALEKRSCLRCHQ